MIVDFPQDSRSILASLELCLSHTYGLVELRPLGLELRIIQGHNKVKPYA